MHGLAGLSFTAASAPHLPALTKHSEFLRQPLKCVHACLLSLLFEASKRDCMLTGACCRQQAHHQRAEQGRRRQLLAGAPCIELIFQFLFRQHVLSSLWQLDVLALSTAARDC